MNKDAKKKVFHCSFLGSLYSVLFYQIVIIIFENHFRRKGLTDKTLRFLLGRILSLSCEYFAIASHSTDMQN